MKEIDGYLELEQNSGNEFHSSGIALNSARNCLRYLIRTRKIKKNLASKVSLFCDFRYLFRREC